jgi:SNF2 family DNA or RNA helicase
VKSIRSVYKLALSGTPVENRLEDLRSVFDAVLPGYLVGPSEFKKLWRERIEIDRDLETADKLKRITSPFLMRRLKTGREIVPDLPDTIASDGFAKFVPEQAALYESVVRRGLNLTAASRVVHYDLWFNPAVENQATDRAFRIGQTKNVFVHRLITAGSFEERIDAMLRDKRELVDLTLSSGESWIAKMSDDQLRRLFER